MDGNNFNNVENQANQYTYAAEGTYEAPAQGGGNGLAIASLVCGIVGLVCCPGGLVSIVALILGFIGRSKCPKKGMATAGIILGIAGILISIIAVIVAILVPGVFAGIFSAMGMSDYYYYY